MRIERNEKYMYNGEQVEVLNILKPYQMGLNSEEHDMYLEYIQDCTEEEVERLYNLDWVAFESTLGVHSMPVEEFQDLIG